MDIASIKRAIRRALPQSVLNRYRLARHGTTWFDFDERSPREVFEHIYHHNMWGKGDGLVVHSGPGSDPSMTAPYVEAVRRFIEARGITSLVDLGCGDFRVGAQLVTDGLRYYGVDIVPRVIEVNTKTHTTPHVTFMCLDAISEELPRADLCLIREVLQHLSNDEIARILRRCRAFRYVIVTESVAAPERFTGPNVSIGHGPNTRADIGSGVVVDAPPFDEHVTGVLVESAGPNQTILRSVIIDNTTHA
jgi:SAM-dependent methyltransferase